MVFHLTDSYTLDGFCLSSDFQIIQPPFENFRTIPSTSVKGTVSLHSFL